MKTGPNNTPDSAGSSPVPCSPLLGKRVRANDGTEGTIVEIAKTPRHNLTVFHVQTDDQREAALFSHEFEVLKANRKLQSDILETSRQLELFVTAFRNLEAQILAFRDRAKEYQQDCERMGDVDGAAENGAVRRSLSELARLAESFKPNVEVLLPPPSGGAGETGKDRNRG